MQKSVLCLFKVIENTPTAMSLGRSFLLILVFLVAVSKNGAKNKEARAKRKKAKVMGGNSCRVVLATIKFIPQIRWARNKAKYGSGLLNICEDTI